LEHSGFSAGSFRDMTRVATLHEGMWTELCLDNREDLLQELQRYIDNLNAFREAIANADARRLQGLFKQGREIKAKVDALPKTPYSIF
jgi:prephenate dehydrogenase